MKRILESFLTIKSTRSTLRRLTLGLAASAAVIVGSGLTAQAAPANDNFAAAINLPGRTGVQTGTDNVDATLEAGEPNPGASDTVWFKWTCPTAGTLTISTVGSTAAAGGEWDAILGIYIGASVDALTALGLPLPPLDLGTEGESESLSPLHLLAPRPMLLHGQPIGTNRLSMAMAFSAAPGDPPLAASLKHASHRGGFSLQSRSQFVRASRMMMLLVVAHGVHVTSG